MSEKKSGKEAKEPAKGSPKPGHAKTSKPSGKAAVTHKASAKKIQSKRDSADKKDTAPLHEPTQKVSHLMRAPPKRTNYWKILTFALLILLAASIATSGFRNWDGFSTFRGLKSSQEFQLDNAYATGSEKAPVTIIEYSDFQCPFCNRFYQQTLPLIQKDYINTGKVKFVFKDFPLSFHRNAMAAAEAARCAGDQGKFFAMHDLLFANQVSWENLADPSQQFIDYAKSLNLSTDKFQTCIASNKYEQQIREDIIEGVQKGVTGTPTFFINGQKVVGAQPFSVFKEVIDSALKGEQPAVQNNTNSIAQISVSQGNNPYLGSNSSMITILEFSDYQCPFCRQYYEQTAPSIIKNYVDTGKAKLVFVDFPLPSSIHPSAEMTAEYAECVYSLYGNNEYWKVHNQIFDKQQEQGTGTVSYSESNLVSWLKGVPGLNVTAVSDCANAHETQQKVANNIAMGRTAGISGTPSFIILTSNPQANTQKLAGMQLQDNQGNYIIREVNNTDGEIGLMVVGAQPYSVFQNAMNAMLGQ